MNNRAGCLTGKMLFNFILPCVFAVTVFIVMRCSDPPEPEEELDDTRDVKLADGKEEEPDDTQDVELADGKEEEPDDSRKPKLDGSWEPKPDDNRKSKPAHGKEPEQAHRRWIKQKKINVPKRTAEFADNNTTLIRYSGDAEHYDITNGVKKIGAEAFKESGILKSVTIPNSVTTIGDRAFEN